MNRHDRRTAKAQDTWLWGMAARLTKLGHLPEHLEGDVKQMMLKAIIFAYKKEQVTRGEYLKFRKALPP